MVDWIRLGQVAHLDENERFQFQQICTHTDTQLRRNMYINSSLRYGPESRIFMARLVLDNDLDEIANNERTNYFVSPPRAPTTQLFDEQEEKNMHSRAGGLAPMEDLIQVLLKYEGLHPIRVSAPLDSTSNADQSIHSQQLLTGKRFKPAFLRFLTPRRTS